MLFSVAANPGDEGKQGLNARLSTVCRVVNVVWFKSWYVARILLHDPASPTPWPYSVYYDYHQQDVTMKGLYCENKC